MLLFERGRAALICLTTLMILTVAGSALAVETGPVERKWGVGYARGLTARLWLGGVWELAISGGPNDSLYHEERFSKDTGWSPPYELEESQTNDDYKRESGFVELQAGRLIARRGPLAAVGFLGVNYNWTDSRSTTYEVYFDDPEENYNRGGDLDVAKWTLTLGLRPSFEIMNFLTIETAFWLAYRWTEEDRTEWREYPNTDRLHRDVVSDEAESFYYGGWTGMGSLQFIVWF